MATIVFGGGCFWCTEAIFKMLRGVESAEPGYAGGTSANPTYQAMGDHIEVVKIDYDPKIIELSTLLTVFFATHDPTTPNRQGADVGSQYRSAILYSGDDQKESAENFIAELNHSSKLGAPIVTEVKQLNHFYPAEGYHRDFYANNPDSTYCQIVINPKLAKVKAKFAELIK